MKRFLYIFFGFLCIFSNEGYGMASEITSTTNCPNIIEYYKSRFDEYYSSIDGPSKWQEDARKFCNLLSSGTGLNSSDLEAFGFFVVNTVATISFVDFWEDKSLTETTPIAKELCELYQTKVTKTGKDHYLDYLLEMVRCFENHDSIFDEDYYNY